MSFSRSIFLSALAAAIGIFCSSLNAEEYEFPNQIKIQRIANELVITGTWEDDTIWYCLDGPRNNIVIYHGISDGKIGGKTQSIRQHPTVYPVLGADASGGIMKIRFYGDTGNDTFEAHPNPPGNFTKVQPRNRFESEIPPCELYGAKGSDHLEGSNYDDILAGGDGIDTLWAYSGSDIVMGGLSGDFIHTDSLDVREVESGDRLFGSQAYAFPPIFDKDGKYRLPDELYGDWDGDRTIDRGYFIRSLHLFVLPNADRGGNQGRQTLIDFGLPVDWAIVGDWNGDGIDQPGVFRAGLFFLDVGNPGWQGQDSRELGIPFGLFGDFPVVGDFHNEGYDRIGIARAGQFHLDIGELGYQGDHFIERDGIQFGGLPGDVPVVGDWNGDGFADVGAYRTGGRATGQAWWFLDDINRGFSSTNSEFREFFGVPFGLPLERPVVWDFDQNGPEDLATASIDGRWRVHLLGN